MKNASDVKKITFVWVCRVLAVSAVFLVAFFELVGVLAPLGIALGLASILVIGIGGWYIPAYFSRYKIEECSDRICVTSGVIIRKSTVVFFSDTVTVTITSSPLMRLLKLRTLILSLAGRRVRLYALSVRDAHRIASEIEKKECGPRE